MSLLFPFIFLGVITYIIGLILNNNVLLMLSSCNLAGCGSDLILFMNFVRLNNFQYTECDNLMKVALYTEEDLSNKNMFGMKLVEVSESIKRDDYKKIDVSNTSKLILILYVIFIIVFLLYRLFI